MALQQLLAQVRRQGPSLVHDLRVIMPAALAFPYSTPQPSSPSSSSTTTMLWERLQQHYPQCGLAWEGVQDNQASLVEGEEERREEESEPWTDALLRMAVPKKKVSHRRQRRKLVHYDCENIVHAHTCQACGKPKLRHRLCDDYERCAAAQPAKYQRTAGGGSSGDGAAGSEASSSSSS